MPAPAVASVAAPEAGKALKNAIGQIVGLNRLRGLRMKTSGGNY